MNKDTELVVEIDENNLDKECIRLPVDYHRFAYIAAEAKRDVQEAKAALDVVQAEVSKDIRNDPESYGLEKVTETALQSAVILQAEYQRAQKRLFKCQHKSELCNAAVWALEHKKRSLTLLVDLHGMGYFSDVKMSREGKEAVQQMTQRKVRRRDND